MKVTQTQQRALLRIFTAKTWPQLLGALLIVGLALWSYLKPSPPTSGELQRGMHLSAQVVGVADGDTITVLSDDRKQYKLRLAFIDAPEKAMPFGQVAKQALSDLIYRQTVTASIIDVDRYGRGVAVIEHNQRDINLQQVTAGLAWHYTQYTKGQSSTDFERYESAQTQAKTQKTGLWADQHPTPPWDWRKANRNN